MGIIPAISAAEVACALGSDLDTCVARLGRQESGLRPLIEFSGELLEFASLLAGWIPDRKLLMGRRYGAASNVAVRVSQAAVARAGWRASDLKDAWLFVGSSRGNTGELLGAFPQRRPVKRFRASNLMHSEIAAAVSIELGIRGPWQVLSNGCASGLDALGLASVCVAQGVAPRALAVAADLPLLGPLLHAFQASGVLSVNNVNDPYSLATSGFLPGEAAAAVTVEPRKPESWCELAGYAANSDAYDSIGLPIDGEGMAECMANTLGNLDGPLAAVCPHATGTLAHREAEGAALAKVIGGDDALPAVLLKPYTGHTLGASGLLEVGILTAFLKRKALPPNLPRLAAHPSTLGLPDSELRLDPGGAVLKLSVGMGGHNASLLLRTPA